MFPDRSFLQKSTRELSSHIDHHTSKAFASKSENFPSQLDIKTKVQSSGRNCRHLSDFRIMKSHEKMGKISSTFCPRSLATEQRTFSQTSISSLYKAIIFGFQNESIAEQTPISGLGVVAHTDPNFVYFPNRTFPNCISTISISKFIEG